MNLVGDMRDVSAETLAAWAEDTDADRRDTAYAAVQRSARNRAKLAGAPRGGKSL
jgi:hypothetical protein